MYLNDDHQAHVSAYWSLILSSALSPIGCKMRKVMRGVGCYPGECGAFATRVAIFEVANMIVTTSPCKEEARTWSIERDAARARRVPDLYIERSLHLFNECAQREAHREDLIESTTN